jgi:UDP-glucose 4-epimerase
MTLSSAWLIGDMHIPDSKIFLTGGAGFLGSHVTKRFLDKGAAVTVFDDLSVGERRLVPDGAELVVGDIRNDELQHAVTYINPDAIVHLAAIHYIPYCNEHPEEVFEVNVMGTRNVVEAAQQSSSLKNVLFASSAAVYPSREGPNSEDSTVGPMGVYGRTKLVGEDLLRLFTAQTDIPSISARLFNIYGPNETNMHLVPAILAQVAREDESIKLGNLTPCRDFVHVDDVARAIMALLERHDSGHEVYNVGRGAELSVRTVAMKIIEASGKELAIIQDEKLMRAIDRPHLEANIEKIHSEIGWEPEIGFEDGLHYILPEYGI